MTANGAWVLGSSLIARIRKFPLAAILVAATISMVVVAAAVFGLSGPQYAVLFDGLSPARGGAVIAALQKDGIPYQLSQNGNVISVPAVDLGRARLELGAGGQPAEGSGGSWKALEDASMTTSEAATQALHLQAIEQSLQSSIETISGASKVQVLLAEPKDTPFLADQPKPKASVVLTGAPQADESLGAAIAQIVSGAVSGLDEKNVVVATGHGTVIYPVSSAGNISQQIAIQERIEAAQESKIRSLLVPILGAGNFRMAVSADVAFAKKTVHSVSYGPKTFAVSADTQSEKKVGGDNIPMGIPGALSNQPPGATAAPLNPPRQGQGTLGGGQGGAQKVKSQTQKSDVPQSESKISRTKFTVDETSSTERPASWAVQKISASVVVNKAALGSLKASALQSLITSTIVAPASEVSVTSAAFVTPGKASAASPQGRITRSIRAGLLVLAALALLFGIVLPLIRWLRPMIVQRTATPVATGKPDLQSQPDPAAANLKQMTDQVARLSQSQPEAMARVLQKWMRMERAE